MTIAAVTVPNDNVDHPGVTSAANLAEATWLASRYTNVEDALLVYRTVDDGNTWVNVFTTPDDQGSAHDFATFGSSFAFICYEAAGDIFYRKSTNGGSLWTSGAAIQASINAEGIGCAAEAQSASIINVVYGEDTVGYQFTRSTNGGTTWSAPELISADEPDIFSVSLVLVSSSVFVASYSIGNAANACKTTDTGVTWSCAEVDGNGLEIALDLFPDGRIGAVYTTPSNGIRFARSDDGVSWVSTEVFTPVAGGSETARPTLAIIDDQRLFVYSGVIAGCNSGSCSRDATSSDAGDTWTAGTFVGHIFGVALCDNSNNQAHRGWAEDNGFGDVLISGHSNCWPGTDTDRAAHYILGTSVADLREPATASLTVSNLVGFDVDPFGTTVIIRNGTALAQTIQTANALTLTGGGSTTTGCSRIDNVFSDGARGLVAFTHCGSADDNPTSLKIQTSGMLDPEFSWCSDVFEGQECPPDVCIDSPDGCGVGSSQFQDNDDFIKLAQVEAFPIDWSTHSSSQQHSTSGTQTQDHYFAFAYSTSTGKIGVAMYSHVGGSTGSDARNQATVQYASQTPSDMCAWTRNGTQYVAAAATGLPTKIWRVTFEFSGVQPEELKGTLSAFPTQLGSAHSGATGIDCTEDRVITRNNFGVVAVGRLNYAADGSVASVTTLWQVATSTGTGRGVAITGDSEFGAYRDDDTIKIANASDGTTLTTLAGLSSFPTSADFLSADFKGSAFWQANQSRVNVYSGVNITDVTCGDDCGVGEGEIPVPPTGGTGDGGDGLFGGSGAQIGSILGVGDFGGRLFLGAFVVLMVGVIAAASHPSRAAPLFIGGALIGVLFSWGFGFFDTASMFVAVVIMALMAAVVAKMGAGD